ncbi:MAG: tRNA (adenosine(37)-N6)-threonylcarbamoyltransferase complex dimerization subunit type 1 TsaB [Ruminococcus sp.]|nr:tRNA (adenosine(37)-N6)-threonylcarbamoyltransferase complex dimerization subunit type 1 TsaB [Ruminococcus sp.]
MHILGIDTSGKTASVAVTDDDKLLWEKTVYTKLTHSQVILPMVSEALKELELDYSDIGCAAIAKGPGSYTGLRIGCAAVKGMCMGQESLKCVGISTLEALSFNCLPFIGRIAAVMFARQGICYAGLYESDGRDIKNVRPDEVIKEDELFPSLYVEKGLMLVGDHAAAIKQKYFADDDRVLTAPINRRLQQASSLCLAACAHLDEAASAEALNVSYLQATKAQKDKAHSENGKEDTK